MQVAQNKPDLRGSMCQMTVFNGSCERTTTVNKSSSSSVISHFLCLYLTTISRHTMMTTTVTMMKPVETTPKTTGTLTRDAVWKRKYKLMFAHTVRHVAHTRLLRSCGGRNTGWPDTYRWITMNRRWSWRGRQFILITIINRHKNMTLANVESITSEMGKLVLIVV